MALTFAQMTPEQKARRQRLRATAVKEFRDEVRRDGEAYCEACGWQSPIPDRPMSGLHVHHVVPVSRGGHDTPSNLVVLCASCHAVTHAVDPRLADREGAIRWLREINEHGTTRRPVITDSYRASQMEEALTRIWYECAKGGSDALQRIKDTAAEALDEWGEK